MLIKSFWLRGQVCVQGPAARRGHNLPDAGRARPPALRGPDGQTLLPRPGIAGDDAPAAQHPSW